MTSQWARWRLKSPASRLFTEAFIQAQIKKHQSSASLAFVRGIHRGPVNSPHKWPVTGKMFPFDDVIMRRAARYCHTVSKSFHCTWFIDDVSEFVKNLTILTMGHWERLPVSQSNELSNHYDEIFTRSTNDYLMHLVFANGKANPHFGVTDVSTDKSISFLEQIHILFIQFLNMILWRHKA